MCRISVQITCLSHFSAVLLKFWRQKRAAFLWTLFCGVGLTRNLRAPVWVGGCWCRPFHVLSDPLLFQTFLFINPKDRLAFLEIDEMCSNTFNLVLPVIPRYEAESTCSSLDPQKKIYDRRGGLCLFQMQMMLHSEGLNCICHSCCQVFSLLRSSWR